MKTCARTKRDIPELLLFAFFSQDELDKIMESVKHRDGELRSDKVYLAGARYCALRAIERGEMDSALSFLKQACIPYFNAPTLPIASRLALLSYQEQPITLRGLFYRAVSAGVYPDTSDNWYRQCGNLLLKLRRSGIVDYACIVDSTRRRLKPSSWSGLADYAESVAECYRKDLWGRQSDYLEIFVEKDAMAAVIEPVTRQYDIHLNIIRGSCSESFVWQVSQAWKEIQKPIFAYYLGDHDPSGLLIEQDLRSRLTEMCAEIDFHWKRIAIDGTDFNRYDLLGFAIKGDRSSKAWQTKHREYLNLYGDRCVEVDAIPANEIRERVRAVIEAHINAQEWNSLLAIEKIERQAVKEFALLQKETIAA